MSFCGECGTKAQDSDKFCRGCGSLLGVVALSEPKMQRQNPSKRKQSDCPVCSSNDAVQKIGAIIDAGVVNSVGSHGGLVGQFGTTNMGYYGGLNLSTSQSAMARRLMVPVPVATFQYGWLLVGVLVSALAVFQWLSRDSVSKDGWWIYGIVSLGLAVIPGLPLGWLLGIISKRIEARRIEPFAENAVRATAYVRESFYCSRDDIAFGNDFFGKPEDFIEKSIGLFSQ